MSKEKIATFGDLPLRHMPTEELRRKVSVPDQSLSPLLRKISESSPINMEPLRERYLRIFTVVSSYWLVSITLVFVNKSLLSGESSLDAPFFITWYQCVITAIACYALSSMTDSLRNKLSFPHLKVSPHALIQVLPLSIIFLGMITFNNLCLKYVGISFYYISRSLTTVFNVLMTHFILHQVVSPKTIFCCVVIVCGFMLGVDQEGDLGTLSIVGTTYGVFASLFVSLYAIYIKRILPKVDNNVWLLTLYNNINAIFLFIPLIVIFGEIPIIVNFPDLFSPFFIFSLTISGVFGFIIGFLTGLQVKVTSPLTHTISGTAKAAAQTVLATQWNGEVKTTSWWLSNVTVLVGSTLYAWVKKQDMVKFSPEEKLPVTTNKE